MKTAKETKTKLAWVIWCRSRNPNISKFRVRLAEVVQVIPSMEIAYVHFFDGSKTWIGFDRLASNKKKFLEKIDALSETFPVPSPRTNPPLNRMAGGKDGGTGFNYYPPQNQKLETS